MLTAIETVLDSASIQRVMHYIHGAEGTRWASAQDFSTRSLLLLLQVVLYYVTVVEDTRCRHKGLNHEKAALRGSTNFYGLGFPLTTSQPYPGPGYGLGEL